MLLEVKDLSFGYDEREILTRLNFRVDEQEIVAIVGPNGGGKTTLSFCLSGIIPHLIKGKLSGQVCLEGTNILSGVLENLTDKIGYVFQDPENQFITLRVRDELKVSASKLSKRQRFIINSLRLKSLLDKAPGELSMGQKQRVALASMLMRRPSVLILDEPGSTIDPHGLRQLSEVLKKFSRQTAIIIFTHDLDFAKSCATRIIGLTDGQIKFDKKTASITDADFEKLFRLDQVLSSIQSEAFCSALSPLKISADKLFYQFPRALSPAIQELTLEIADNWGLAGFNGSGKTTLLLLLAGLMKPTKGSISYNQALIKKMTSFERLKNVGVVFQNPNHQIFTSTIFEELSFGLKNQGVSEMEIEKRVNEVAALFELGDLSRDPHTLSFGWRKILALAGVWILRPKYFFLDEPELGLDLYFKKKFEVIADRAYENGQRLIIASHRLDLLRRFSKNISYLENGRLNWTKSVDAAIAEIKKNYDPSDKNYFHQAVD